MPETVSSFQSLPPEYRRVIQTAEEKFDIAIAPLQELAGGYSGAIVYLVRVASTGSGDVQHLILKLDRKNPKASSDEISRHEAVQQSSPPDFTRENIPSLIYDRVEVDNAIAIFYTIAGQSLHNFRTLSNYRRQSRVQTLFSATVDTLLGKWNANREVETFSSPELLLESWLGFRLNPGQKIEQFLIEVCRLKPAVPGFIVNGKILPNPLHYVRDRDRWGSVRPLDALVGLQHSDLNINNILAKFARQSNEIEGYFLIDFAQFKTGKPLFYDHRYLEMSYLVQAIERGSFEKVVELIERYSETGFLNADQAPIEMTGVNEVILAGRTAFADWVQNHHPSLEDDLWGQYWLAGAAAGLGYCHKDGLPDEVRLAALIFAAANLKQFFSLFGVALPSDASQLSLDPDRGDTVFDGGASARIIRHDNLPAPPTNFIGRETELAEITELLQQPGVSLVTVLGPGGTGKTRISLEAGRALMDDFPNGVFFIDLAQVTDPSLVVVTIAHALGIREGGGQPPLETLKEFLKDREMLLILDNLEQVSTAGNDLSGVLAVTNSKFLVTSRIPLQLRAEREYPLDPLTIPSDETLSTGEALEFESVALFRQQARSVLPQFEITAENLETVVEICRRLDGLPLAIEIAAARCKMLPPEALLRRLDKSLNLLVSGAKDLPVRQQTLRQTINWSYQLLEPEVQALFVRLGVFAGGFTLEAAEALSPQMDLDVVFSGIETLLNNSLLRQVRSLTDEPRFDMLQTIREFTHELAVEAGLWEELKWAHTDFFTQQAQTAANEAALGSEDTELWLDRFDIEHDNYRAVLSWALDHPDQGAIPVMVIMGQLLWFWYRYGHLKEGSDWTARALAIAEGMGDSIPHATALTGRAYLALWSGELILAGELSEKAVAMCERLNFDYGLSMSKLCYGTALINLGRDKEAYRPLIDSAELYDQQEMTWMQGTALVHLANVLLGMGDPEQSIKWLDTAMPYLRASHDKWSMAFGLNNYGEVARTLGQYEQAEEYYRQTEELYKLADAKGDQARLTHTFGYIALHKGEYTEAEANFRQSLEDFRELGNQRGIAECLAGMAVLASAQGKDEWAIPLLAAADALLTSFGGAWWPADRVEIDRAREQMQTKMGEDFNRLWQQGAGMDMRKAISYAAP